MAKKALCILIIFIATFSVMYGKTVNIGFIDPNPIETIEKHTVIAEYITKELKKDGVDNCKIVVLNSTAEMTSAINANEIDVFIDTIFSVLIVNKKAKLDISMNRWKKGVEKYKSIFLVHKDSDIKDLKKLKGKKIGFEDETSTSARWLPQVILKEHKYQLIELSSYDESVPSNKVGYCFTNSDKNTAVWLMQKKIDIGVLSDNDYNELSAGLKKNLKVVHESFSVPRQLIAFRKSLDKNLKQQLKTLLIELDDTEKGREVLKSWEKTKMVEPVNKEVNNSIVKITKLIKYVENQ